MNEMERTKFDLEMILPYVEHLKSKMEKYKPYYMALRGEPHFKDEMPIITHHAIDILVNDGKCVIQETLFDARELVICNNERKSTEKV